MKLITPKTIAFIVFLSVWLFIYWMIGRKDPGYGWHTFQKDLIVGIIVASTMTLSQKILENKKDPE